MASTTNRETAEEANAALVQRWFHEVWSHGNGDIATTANDRFNGAVLQLGNRGYEEVLWEYLACKIEQREIGRGVHPS